MSDQDCIILTVWVHEHLLQAYGSPELKPKQDPLSELIQTILSQNTNDRNTARSFAELRRQFPTWEQVILAPSTQVADAIRVGGLADIKAPRIQAILTQVQRETGRLDLSHLAEMTVEQARTYLLSLHGVGSKTAACVLLFSLGMPALPVDTHVHRVSLRVGLVPPKSDTTRTQQLLESYLPPQDYYPFHLNMIHHGRVCCLAIKPRCSVCNLSSRCSFYCLQSGSAPL